MPSPGVVPGPAAAGNRSERGVLNPTPDLCNQKLEVGPCHLCFNTHSRWVYCKLKLKTSSLQGQTSRRFRVRGSLRRCGIPISE